MRPINLLPPYIYDKQKKVQLAAFWSIAALAVVAGFIYWQSEINKVLDGIAEEQQTATRLKTEHDNLVGQITQENNNNEAIQRKQDFIANAQTYNDAWPQTYSMVRDVVSPNVILRRIIIDPQQRQTVSMAGSARTEMDIVKWWMALKNDTTRFQSVRFELPPHPYAPGGQATTAGGPGLAGAPGGARGFSGGPGSGGGPMAAGVSGAGGGPGSGGGGFSGGMSMPPGMGSGGMGGMSMPPGMGGGGGFRGGGFPGGGGGAQSADVGPDILEGRPVINFVATAVLNQPLAGGIATPVWPPGGGAGAGATGGFGGPAGFSGGPGGGGTPMATGASGAGGPASFGGGGGGGGSALRTAE